MAYGSGFEPSLTEAELQDAEDSLGVRFPQDYRRFLLEVGAGGAGPAYGIFPLRRGAQGWHWEAEPTHRTDTDRLGEPFTPHHISGVEIDPIRLCEPQQYDFEYRDEYEQAHRAWEEVIWHRDRTAGSICLSDHGCMRKYWLVVTGEERGMIWRDYRVDGIDLTPLFDAQGNRMTFGRWFLAWLATQSAGSGSVV